MTKDPWLSTNTNKECNKSVVDPKAELKTEPTTSDSYADALTM